MPAESVSDSAGWEPVITRPDPMSPAEWEALLAASLDEVEPPGDGEEHLDPEGCVLPPDEDLAAIEAETDRFAAERAWTLHRGRRYCTDSPRRRWIRPGWVRPATMRSSG